MRWRCPDIRKLLADGWVKEGAFLRLYSGKVVKIQYLSKAYYRNIRVVQSDPSRLPRLSTPTIVSYLSGEPDEDPRDRMPTSRKRDERLAILCKDPDGDVVGIWDQNQDVKESKRIETTGGIMRCKACGSSIRTIYPCKGHKNLHLYIWYVHKIKCERLQKLYEDEFKREAGDGDDEGTRSSSETRGISPSPQRNLPNLLQERSGKPSDSSETGFLVPMTERQTSKRRSKRRPELHAQERPRKRRHIPEKDLRTNTRQATPRASTSSSERVESRDNLGLQATPMTRGVGNEFHFRNCTVEEMVFL